MKNSFVESNKLSSNASRSKVFIKVFQKQNYAVKRILIKLARLFQFPTCLWACHFSHAYKNAFIFPTCLLACCFSLWARLIFRLAYEHVVLAVSMSIPLYFWLAYKHVIIAIPISMPLFILLLLGFVTLVLVLVSRDWGRIYTFEILKAFLFLL